MTYDIHAIFDQGVFRPLEPIALPNGTKVQLSVDHEGSIFDQNFKNRLRSPRLANPAQSIEFEMDVREDSDAGV